jgi:hypothetical protein
MLRKIENISASAEFKNNSRFSSNVNGVAGIVQRKNSASDSFSYSNAFKFLSNLKWNLKSLKKNNRDEYEIDFIIDEFEFHTAINPLDLFSKSTLYKIINFNQGEFNISLFEIWLKFFYEIDSAPIQDEQFQIEYLYILKERINQYSGLFISESSKETYSMLLDKIESELTEELCLIHTDLLRFLEKVTGESLLSARTTNDQSNSNLLIVEYLNANH